MDDLARPADRPARSTARREARAFALSKRCWIKASWRVSESARDHDVQSRGLLAPLRARRIPARAPLAAAQPREQFGRSARGYPTLDRRPGISAIARPQRRGRPRRYARAAR